MVSVTEITLEMLIQCGLSVAYWLGIGLGPKTIDFFSFQSRQKVKVTAWDQNLRRRLIQRKCVESTHTYTIEIVFS